MTTPDQRFPARHVTEHLDGYRPATDVEARDVDRIRAMVAREPDPWSRSLPLHVTASAVIVHPPTAQVLLRWHARQESWLHVGGHGDPGESDPLAVALREAREETGLTDLTPWPYPELQHVVIVPVGAGRDEPAHDHADLRFVLATATPEAIRPERPGAALRWVTLPESADVVVDNLRETLDRIRI
jgi:8-oxo-dGTP pyrophosphatase MutT (NUDIX family)